MDSDAIGRVFFQQSDLQYILVALLCALIVLYMAKRRFDVVATTVDWKELSQRTRSWTSRQRYLSALALYSSLNLIFFRLLLYFPEALDQLPALNVLPVKTDWLKPFLRLPYIHPPLAVLVMVALFDSTFGLARPLESAIRRWLQHLGSVPRYVRQLLRRLRRAEIAPRGIVLTRAASLQRQAGRPVTLAQGGRPILPLERAFYLQAALDTLLRDGSPDGPQAFLVEHRGFVEQLRQDVLSLAGTPPPESAAADEAFNSRLEALLDRLYLTLSCALGSVGPGDADVALDSVGIEARTFDETDPQDVIKVLKDDITLAVLLFVFVVYPAVLLLFWLGNWRPRGETGLTIGLLWPLMLVSIVIPGLLSAFFAVRDQVSCPAGEQRLPYQRCVSVGLLAAAFSAVALVWWDLFHPHHHEPFVDRMTKLAPFGLVAGALSASLALTFLVRVQRSRWIDAVIVGAATMIAGLIACFMSDMTANPDKRLHVLLALALLGCAGFCIGSVVPHAYRRRLGRPARAVGPSASPPAPLPSAT